jgi:hypothetical protein
MYDKKEVTMSGNFPVQDITHVPRRTQSGNIKVLTEQDIAPTEAENLDDVKIITGATTVERAVGIFENLSEESNTKEKREFFRQVANWLREYASYNKVKMQRELSKDKEE